LLHALGECASVWAWVMPGLARGRRVYAPDLPGLGDGGPLAGRSSADFVRFAERFLDALGLQRAAVVGSSFGGLVALRLALADPSRVEALGLVSAAGLGREVSPALVLPTLPGYGEAAVALGRTSFGAAQRGLGRAEVGPGGQREVLLPKLPELAAPTLVVWGARDRVFPARQARDAAAWLQDGRVDLIPAGGHLPQVERPERFARTIARFLDGVADGP